MSLSSPPVAGVWWAHTLDWLYDSLSSPPVAGVWWAHTLDWLYDSLLSTCSWCVVSASTWLTLWLSLLSTCSWCVVSASTWLALWLSLLSTCSWCVVSASTWLTLWLSLLSTCSWCVVGLCDMDKKYISRFFDFFFDFDFNHDFDTKDMLYLTHLVLHIYLFLPSYLSCTSCFCTFLYSITHLTLYFFFYLYICLVVVLLLYNFYSLHCPLSGPDLIYISLLIIPCIIYHVTNTETLTFTVINAFCVNLKHISKGNQLKLFPKSCNMSLEQTNGKIHIYIYIYIIYILYIYIYNNIYICMYMWVIKSNK